MLDVQITGSICLMQNQGRILSELKVKRSYLILINYFTQNNYLILIEPICQPILQPLNRFF